MCEVCPHCLSVPLIATHVYYCQTKEVFVLKGPLPAPDLPASGSFVPENSTLNNHAHMHAGRNFTTGGVCPEIFP